VWIIVSSLADLAELFAAVPKTEQGGGWLAAKFALRRGAERQITIRQSAFLCGQFWTWHEEDRRRKYRVILRSGFCSDFVTRR